LTACLESFNSKEIEAALTVAIKLDAMYNVASANEVLAAGNDKHVLAMRELIARVTDRLNSLKKFENVVACQALTPTIGFANQLKVRCMSRDRHCDILIILSVKSIGGAAACGCL
jgi:hypothetical protein